VERDECRCISNEILDNEGAKARSLTRADPRTRPKPANAGVRRVRCCPGSSRGRQGSWRGLGRCGGARGAPGARLPVAADGSAASAVCPGTTCAGGAPRRRIRSAGGAAAGSRRRRIAGRSVLWGQVNG
jgi:hypothetical protein